MTTPTDRFAKAFNPQNMTHVMWLSKFFEYAEKLDDRSTVDIGTFINTNPMGLTLKKEEMLDWVHIHFILGMKYAQNVLKGTAFVPSTGPGGR